MAMGFKGGGPTIQINLHGDWNVFRANQEATLINGSYSLTDEHFVGSFTGPIIDTQGSNPGTAWQLIDEKDFDPSTSFLAVNFILYGADIESHLRAAYSDTVPTGLRPLPSTNGTRG